MTDDQAKLIEIATLMHKANVSDDTEDKRRFKAKASEISEKMRADLKRAEAALKEAKRKIRSL
jgi:hypothetical protein